MLTTGTVRLLRTGDGTTAADLNTGVATVRGSGELLDSPEYTVIYYTY